MSPADEDKDLPRREWVATTDTGLKTSTALASTLTESEKLIVAKGAHLTATLAEEDHAYWMISGGHLDGVSFPEAIRFVYKNHWRLLDQAVDQEAAFTTGDPIPTIPPKPESILAEPLGNMTLTEPHAQAGPAETTAIPPAGESTVPISQHSTDTKLSTSKNSPKSKKQRHLFASFKRRLTEN
jgi:hypothetical protein